MRVRATLTRRRRYQRVPRRARTGRRRPPLFPVARPHSLRVPRARTDSVSPSSLCGWCTLPWRARGPAAAPPPFPSPDAPGPPQPARGVAAGGAPGRRARRLCTPRPRSRARSRSRAVNTLAAPPPATAPPPPPAAATAFKTHRAERSGANWGYRPWLNLSSFLVLHDSDPLHRARSHQPNPNGKGFGFGVRIEGSRVGLTGWRAPAGGSPGARARERVRTRHARTCAVRARAGRMRPQGARGARASSLSLLHFRARRQAARALRAVGHARARPRGGGGNGGDAPPRRPARARRRAAPPGGPRRRRDGPRCARDAAASLHRAAAVRQLGAHYAQQVPPVGRRLPLSHDPLRCWHGLLEVGGTRKRANAQTRSRCC